MTNGNKYIEHIIAHQLTWYPIKLRHYKHSNQQNTAALKKCFRKKIQIKQWVIPTSVEEGQQYIRWQNPHRLE
jgi:hypothetical protein